MLLGPADRAVRVNGVGEVGTDVRVGHGLESVGENAGFGEGLDPEFPVLAAHDLDGVGDLVVRGGLDADGVHLAGIGVDVLLRVGAADGFEDTLVGLPVGRVGAAGRGEAVDDAVDLTEVGLDRGDDFVFHLGGKGIAVEAFCVESCFGGGFLEGDGIVPAGAAGLVLDTGLFKKDTDGRGTAAEGGHDARGEAVAGRGADDEDLFRRIGKGGFGLHVVDLRLDVGGASLGMGGGADKTSDLRSDYHLGRETFSMFKER